MSLEGSIGEYAIGEFDVTSSGLSSGSTGFQMYLGGSWVDISADVRANPHPHFRRGFEGSTPTDRLATTGTMSFSLDNSSGNSGGLLGYYSPDHANVRSGFGISTQVRWYIVDTGGSTHNKFVGWIVSIEPAFGQFAGRAVDVQAVDFMEFLAATNLERLGVQLNKRPDEIIQTIINSLPADLLATLSTSYGTSPETLAYALHTDEDEKTSIYNAIQKVLQSDLGYVSIASANTLRYENRYQRLLNESELTLNDTMTGLTVTRRADMIFNNVRVTTYPVRIDAAATTVLATVQSEFSVSTGETITLAMRYRDPSGASTRVSGTDMVTPADSTDYEFTASSGSGNNDLSGSVAVAASFGANSALMTITNNSAGTAYSGGNETFQLRGKGIYPYDPVESIASDSDSISEHGMRTLTFNMPYVTNVNSGIDFSAELLSRYKDPYSNVDGVTFSANRSSTFYDYAALLDIGNRITVTETVTGISADYFINGVEFELIGPNLIMVTWSPLESAGNVALWILDDTTFSVLNTTTIPSF